MFRISPFSPSRSVRRRPVELFRVFEAFEPLWEPPFPRQTYPIDVLEHDDHYIVEIEMPGVTQDELKIEFTESRVTIGVNRKATERAGRALHSERRSSAEQLALDIPSLLATDGHDARLANGVLTLTLRKPPIEKPKAKAIPVR
jgi:HSP20 family protein